MNFQKQTNQLIYLYRYDHNLWAYSKLINNYFRKVNNYLHHFAKTNKLIYFINDWSEIQTQIYLWLDLIIKTYDLKARYNFEQAALVVVRSKFLAYFKSFIWNKKSIWNLTYSYDCKLSESLTYKDALCLDNNTPETFYNKNDLDNLLNQIFNDLHNKNKQVIDLWFEGDSKAKIARKLSLSRHQINAVFDKFKKIVQKNKVLCFL